MFLGKFPVFPLRTLCFPGHKIPLRVFEDRYAQMLQDIADNPTFVISLISSGEEVGREATPYRVGTLVEFGRVVRQDDFQLIAPQGVHRVYLETFDRESQPYLQAECSVFNDEPTPKESTIRLPELEAKILAIAGALGPEESRNARDVMEGMRTELDTENFSLFLCGCLHLPTMFLQRLLESRSFSYRIENALNLLAQNE